MSNPDVFTLAKNFGNSIVNHLADGLKKVTDEEFNKRFDICKSCDQFNREQDKCNHCGCFLKVKASWNSEKCPLNKW
jgi:hypothetical protein